MVTLYFTKLFTDGFMKGVRYNDSMSFTSADDAASFLKVMRKGVKKPIGGSPYKVVDASFQSIGDTK